MKYCSTCGSELHDNAVVCVKCGCAVPPLQQATPPTQQSKDNGSSGMTLISLLFPLIGFLLYFMYKDDKPVTADGCRRGALTGLTIGIVIAFLYIIIIATSI